MAAGRLWHSLRGEGTTGNALLQPAVAFLSQISRAAAGEAQRGPLCSHQLRGCALWIAGPRSSAGGCNKVGEFSFSSFFLLLFGEKTKPGAARCPQVSAAAGLRAQQGTGNAQPALGASSIPSAGPGFLLTIPSAQKSLEASTAGLDGAWNTLGWWKMSLSMGLDGL